jgi:hypothetical protein
LWSNATTHCSIQLWLTSCWNEWASSVATMVTRTRISIAIVNGCSDCDDAREWANRLWWWSHEQSSNAIARRLANKQVQCNESCNEPWHVRPWWRSLRTIKSSNTRANEAQRSQARKLARSNQLIDEIDQHDVRESGQSRGSLVMRIASKYRKRHNNQLDCDCCLVSFPCGQVHRYLHSQTTQKGSSSLNKLDNKPDWFFTTQHA